MRGQAGARLAVRQSEGEATTKLLKSSHRVRRL
jgi:hypothetical protein